jgi:hypothetical protein
LLDSEPFKYVSKRPQYLDEATLCLDGALLYLDGAVLCLEGDAERIEGMTARELVVKRCVAWVRWDLEDVLLLQEATLGWTLQAAVLLQAAETVEVGGLSGSSGDAIAWSQCCWKTAGS